jgi:hypothetical protein
MSELDVTEDDVREEHLRAVHRPAQWTYLFGVMAAGTLLMLALIALLDAASA